MASSELYQGSAGVLFTLSWFRRLRFLVFIRVYSSRWNILGHRACVHILARLVDGDIGWSMLRRHRFRFRAVFKGLAWPLFSQNDFFSPCRNAAIAFTQAEANGAAVVLTTAMCSKRRTKAIITSFSWCYGCSSFDRRYVTPSRELPLWKKLCCLGQKIGSATRGREKS